MHPSQHLGRILLLHYARIWQVRMEDVTLCHFGGHPGRSVYRGLLDILDPRSGRGSVFGMTQKCDLGVRYYPAVGLSLLVIPVSIYTPLWEVQIGVFWVSGTTPPDMAILRPFWQICSENTF